jgi:hypothetical protein
VAWAIEPSNAKEIKARKVGKSFLIMFSQREIEKRGPVIGRI